MKFNRLECQCDKNNKCKCGKTKNSNGNCDGSHASKFKTISYMFLALNILFSSFTFASNNQPHNDKEINVKKSNIIWKGKKVTGSHEGTINVKSGFLRFHDSKLIGGELEINMNTLECTDLTGEYKMKLEGHLKSEDFFAIESYPVANLKILTASLSSENLYSCTADIIIKGKKETIKFNVNLNKKNASTILKIDRTKFGVKYGSGSFFKGLGDNMIYDEFDLEVNLIF